MGASTLSITALTEDPNGITAAAVASAAGTLGITGDLASGGTVTLNNGQILTIDPGANDNSGVNFVFTGKDADNRTQTETITGGASAKVNTTLYFKEITTITHDGAIVGSVDIGVEKANGAVTPMRPLNWKSQAPGVALAGEMTGTMTWKVQATFDTVSTNTGTITTTSEVWHDHTELVSKTANATGNYEFIPRACRGVLTAYTAGTFNLQVLED
jgi:hypothetical protein